MANIYRMQAYGSIMFEYFYIRFIDLVLKSKSLLESTNAFCPNDQNENV